MQISGFRIFAFVEGNESDLYFYGRICEKTCTPNGILHAVLMARELPALTGGHAGGGKPRLLAWYNYMKDKSALINTSLGKTTVTIFYLDKDVDDFLWNRKKLRHSRHIVYTSLYNVESHIYAEGNITEAVAAAASIDIQTAASVITSSDDWRRWAAESWKDWVKLCLFAAIHRAQGVPNFGADSPINTPRCAPTDPTAFRDHLTLLATNCSFTHRQFARAFENLSHLVDKLYDADDYGRVFNGKWYPKILEDQVKDALRGRPINFQGLSRRLTNHVVQTLDFDAKWADHFKEPLMRLSSRL